MKIRQLCFFTMLVGLILSMQVMQTIQSNVASAETPVKEASASASLLSQGVQAYKDGQFESARTLLEQVVQNHSDAYTCYYAALANFKCAKSMRATALFNYVIQNFPSSEEAKLSAQAVEKSAPVNSTRSRVAAKKGVGIGQQAFSADDIARDGYNGVDQSNAPNCWFMSVMAALAALPRGQIALADLIRVGGPDLYIVRFSDHTEYTVSKSEARKVRDRALWAKIIEVAERKKFPDNVIEKPLLDTYEGSVSVAIGLLTGRHSESVRTKNMSEEEIGEFVYGATKSQNPIVAATMGKETAGIERMLVPGHAYSVVGYEPNKHMIVLRNPWGGNPKNLKVENDPLHLTFEEEKDGILKISVTEFRKYFWGLRRAFI